MLLVCAPALSLVLLLVGCLSSAPAAADSGPWEWPLAGPHEVIRPFSPPAARYGAGHRGVDLPAAPGAAVRAAGAGRVTYAGMLAGRGVVVVSHGALRTTYEPVTAAVRVGRAVALGEVIGQLDGGHAGCPTAACLHWGLRRGEDYLDPVRLVERGPVRLLPPVVAAAEPRGATRLAAAAAPERPEPAPVPPAAAGPPPEVDEPLWSLRAAEAPLGAAAVVALVVGIGLLTRPRPPPPAPAPVSGGVAAIADEPPEDGSSGPTAPLLVLDEARVRRHAAS